MPDREKVIKGLECCSKRNGDCKYAEEPICPYVESCRAKDYSAVKRDALELLKESVQIEPLCEFLAEYAVPPQSLGIGFTNDESKQAWKDFIQNRLET